MRDAIYIGIVFAVIILAGVFLFFNSKAPLTGETVFEKNGNFDNLDIDDMQRKADLYDNFVSSKAKIEKVKAGLFFVPNEEGFYFFDNFNDGVLLTLEDPYIDSISSSGSVEILIEDNLVKKATFLDGGELDVEGTAYIFDEDESFCRNDPRCVAHISKEGFVFDK